MKRFEPKVPNRASPIIYLLLLLLLIVAEQFVKEGNNWLSFIERNSTNKNKSLAQTHHSQRTKNTQNHYTIK